MRTESVGRLRDLSEQLVVEDAHKSRSGLIASVAYLMVLSGAVGFAAGITIEKAHIQSSEQPLSFHTHQPIEPSLDLYGYCEIDPSLIS